MPLLLNSAASARVWGQLQNMSTYHWFVFVRNLRISLCLLGVVLSVYALYVEVKKTQDKSFQALCDINSRMSCSKVFSSK